MSRNYLVLCLFNISICFVAVTVGRIAIIGGEKAQENQFPYQVSVQIRNHHMCGGAIIDDSHVLTVAHCLIGSDGRFYKDQFFVVAGTNNFEKTQPPAQMIQVKKIYVPAEYKSAVLSTTGDIAVLQLKEPLGQQLKHLGKLKLPANKQADYTDKTAKISGFGWTSVNVTGNDESGMNTDKQLYYADADIISNQQCVTEHPRARIAEKELCARVQQHHSKTRGVCLGDSGGPLVYDKTVIGLLSISPTGCSERNKAAVYTRVSHYLNFIYNATHDIESHDILTHQSRHSHGIPCIGCWVKNP